MMVSALSAIARGNRSSAEHPSASLGSIPVTTFGSNDATLPRSHASIVLYYTLGFEKQCVRSFVLLASKLVSRTRRHVILRTNALDGD
jgi:hypothetical protein